MRLSPLRYAGGKSKAIKILKDYIPENTQSICSPFFGGGSLELYCANMGIRVYGYDIFEPLVDFWQTLLTRPNQLADRVEKFMPLSRRRFKQLKQEQFSLRSKLQRATVFYVLNRTSFSGSTLSGGMASDGKNDNPRFTKSSIDKLRNFNIRNFSVNFADYRISIPNHEKSLLYLDPPYDIEKPVLYGVNGHLHSNFDYDELFEILKKRDNWILSYNNSKDGRKLYSDYEMIKPKWNYGMSQDKTSNELLILSHDLSKKLLIKQRVR